MRRFEFANRDGLAFIKVEFGPRLTFRDGGKRMGMEWVLNECHGGFLKESVRDFRVAFVVQILRE